MPDYNHIKIHERDIVDILNGAHISLKRMKYVMPLVNIIKSYFPRTTKYELINLNHNIPGDILGINNSERYHIELKFGEFTTEAQTTASILGPHYGNWNDVNPKYLSAIKSAGFRSLNELRYKLKHPSTISRSDPRFQWLLKNGIKVPTLHQKIANVTNELKSIFLRDTAPYMDLVQLTNYFNRVRKGYTKFSSNIRQTDKVDYYIINNSGIFYRKPIYKPTYEIMGSELHFQCSKNPNQYVKLRPHWKNKGQGGLNPCFMVWMESPERLL